LGHTTGYGLAGNIGVEAKVDVILRSARLMQERLRLPAFVPRGIANLPDYATKETAVRIRTW
jgi:hypothetical protein